MSKEPVSPVTITDWRGATVLPYATWTQIRSLQHQGQSIRQIARGLDLSRNTVRQALRSPTPPQYGPRAPRPSLVDAYRAYLAERAPVVGYNAWRLYLELWDRGYAGQYEMVKRAVRPLRTTWQQAALATVRFETAPGVQWQADWSSTRDVVASGPPRLQLFTMVSSYSRRLYAELTLDQTLATLLMCHEHAFDWFSGLPTEILYDNPKTIVLRRDAAGTHIEWNPRFWDFARYYGLRPQLCRRIGRARKAKWKPPSSTSNTASSSAARFRRSRPPMTPCGPGWRPSPISGCLGRFTSGPVIAGQPMGRPCGPGGRSRATSSRPRGAGAWPSMAWSRWTRIDTRSRPSTSVRRSMSSRGPPPPCASIGTGSSSRPMPSRLADIRCASTTRTRMALALLSGLSTPAAWRLAPLPDVEVRDLAVYAQLEEEVHA